MAKEPGFSEFRTKANGLPIFTDGSARERLAATLNERLESGPTPEQRREAIVNDARAAVDAAWPQDQMGAAANRVIAAGKAQAEALDAQKRDMKPERFLVWRDDAAERLATYFLDETNKFRELVENTRQKFPRSTLPFPVTSPDIAALALRLSQLDKATPEEAQAQIQDGVHRGDFPYLMAAKANLRSWTQYRNAWQDRAAQRLAGDLVDQIDGLAETPENVKNEYANDRLDRSVSAWNRLVTIVQNELRIDPIHRQVGELSPLLEIGA